MTDFVFSHLSHYMYLQVGHSSLCLESTSLDPASVFVMPVKLMPHGIEYRALACAIAHAAASNVALRIDDYSKALPCQPLEFGPIAARLLPT